MGQSKIVHALVAYSPLSRSKAACGATTGLVAGAPAPFSCEECRRVLYALARHDRRMKARGE